MFFTIMQILLFSKNLYEIFMISRNILDILYMKKKLGKGTKIDCGVGFAYAYCEKEVVVAFEVVFSSQLSKIIIK